MTSQSKLKMLWSITIRIVSSTLLMSGAKYLIRLSQYYSDGQPILTLGQQQYLCISDNMDLSWNFDIDSATCFKSLEALQILKILCERTAATDTYLTMLKFWSLERELFDFE